MNKIDQMRVFRAVVTSAKSPEEMLSDFDKYGIEWHVTEKGALWYKCWQVGSENFVPKETALKIRSSRSTPEEGQEMDWLARNLDTLRVDYGGKWVAVSGEKIVAAAQTLPELMDQLGEGQKPLITFIPQEPVVWSFTYAG
jgi:hypothetical protein